MRALVAGATLALLVAGAPAVAHSSPATIGGTEAATASTVGARSGAATARPAPRPSVVRTKRSALRIVRVSDSRPVVGARVAVTGRTNAKARRVVLQSRVGKGTWKRVARTRAAKGQFRFAVKVAAPGTRSYRVVVPRTKRVRKAVSPGLVLRPRPVPAPKPAPTPTPAPSEADVAAQVTAELDRAVRAYRLEQGLVDRVGTNDCLAGWATGHAARMAETGIFAHSSSSEWNDFGVVRADDACEGRAPAYRAEAIDFVSGDDPVRVAAAAVAHWKSAWMHDEVLLDTFGSGRTLSFGAAKGLSPVAADGSRTPVWYVVAVVARNL